MRLVTQKPSLQHPLQLGDSRNMVLRLIMVNAVLFVAMNFIKVLYLVTGAPDSLFYIRALPWLTLPADPRLLLQRPWTLLSYMFMNVSFWSFLGGMVWLWWLGGLLQDLAGYRRVLPLYLYGGLAGAACYLAAYQFIGPLHAFQSVANTAEIGAVASISALVAAVCTLSPGYRVFPALGGGIPLVAVGALYLGLSLLSPASGEPLLGFLSALAGGVLMGVIFSLQLLRGRDPGAVLNRALDWGMNLLEPSEVPPGARLRRQKLRQGRLPFRRLGPVSSRLIDELLDKINRSGYDSLSAEEKDILLRASKDNTEA